MKKTWNNETPTGLPLSADPGSQIRSQPISGEARQTRARTELRN